MKEAKRFERWISALSHIYVVMVALATRRFVKYRYLFATVKPTLASRPEALQ